MLVKSRHVHKRYMPIVIRYMFRLLSTLVSNNTIAPSPGKGNNVTPSICLLILPTLSHLFRYSVVGAFAIRRIVWLFRTIGYTLASFGSALSYSTLVNILDMLKIRRGDNVGCSCSLKPACCNSNVSFRLRFVLDKISYTSGNSS